MTETELKCKKRGFQKSCQVGSQVQVEVGFISRKWMGGIFPCGIGGRGVFRTFGGLREAGLNMWIGSSCIFFHHCNEFHAEQIEICVCIYLRSNTCVRQREIKGGPDPVGGLSDVSGNVVP